MSVESRNESKLILESVKPGYASTIAMAMQLSGAPAQVTVEEADRKTDTLITASGSPEELAALVNFVRENYAETIRISDVPVRE